MDQTITTGSTTGGVAPVAKKKKKQERRQHAAPRHTHGSAAPPHTFAPALHHAASAALCRATPTPPGRAASLQRPRLRAAQLAAPMALHRPQRAPLSAPHSNRTIAPAPLDLLPLVSPSTSVPQPLLLILPRSSLDPVGGEAGQVRGGVGGDARQGEERGPIGGGPWVVGEEGMGGKGAVGRKGARGEGGVGI
ncbi:hypothetical protein PVAP13_7KG013718 [Panicum virgatum]|uniref:Uncharacterized protein n=1 Tax=Panicum virgatum TaxID=38727 RepID=A0A8T0QAG8_PANVG|nr:hypothetical protein PVAP13_7KG013718 [Panicum virgatum]